MITCKTCKIERDEKQFQAYTKNGKRYYSKKLCRVCSSVKNIRLDSKLSPKCLQFLEKIEAQRGFICYIDAFLLAHYHIETFGYRETNMDVKEELTKMYKDLLKVKRESIKNNI